MLFTIIVYYSKPQQKNAQLFKKFSFTKKLWFAVLDKHTEGLPLGSSAFEKSKSISM